MIRKWVAPHAGTIRIEDNTSYSYIWHVSDVGVTIRMNDKVNWPGRVIKRAERLFHDLTVNVHKGDAVCFVVK